MVEVIKAGLRETIGEAIKTRIKAAVSALFNLDKKEKEDPVKQELETQTEVLERIEAVLKKRSPITGSTGSAEQAKQIFGNIGKEVTELKIPSMETVLKDIAKSSEEGSEATKSGFMKMIETLFTLIKSLFTKGEGGAGAGGLGGIVQTIASIFLAKGGVVKGGITPMANGAMVTSPTLAMVGEGPRNEAVVPLPNNREIPVEMKAPSGDTITIEQNFDFTNSSPETVALLRAEARAIEERTVNTVFGKINQGGKYAKMVGRR